MTKSGSLRRRLAGLALSIGIFTGATSAALVSSPVAAQAKPNYAWCDFLAMKGLTADFEWQTQALYEMAKDSGCF
jgi:hypothetical protein